MPNINCCNLNEEKVLALSKATSSILSDVIGCPLDWLNYIYKNEKIIISDELNDETCYIHIEWFKRSNEVMDKVVAVLDEALRELGFQEVIIYFSELSFDHFYENQKKFEL